VSKIIGRKLARLAGLPGYFCVFGASTVTVAVGKFPGHGDPSTLPAARAAFAKQRHVRVLSRPGWGDGAFLACKTVGSPGFSNLFCYADTPRFKVAFSNEVPELTNTKAVGVGDALVRSVWANVPSLRP
jgi:hypothetical protein